MDVNKNYYSVLGVTKEATDDEIKKSYRQLAMKYHPDRNPGDKESEAKFKEVAEAYDILSSTDKKQKYDTASPHGTSYNPGFGGFGGFDNFGANFENFGFSGGIDDIFNFMKGGGNFRNGTFVNPGMGNQYRENLDISVQINRSLEDIYNNKNIDIRYNRNVKCAACNGTGTDINGEQKTCPKCGGRCKDSYGNVCMECSGTGKVGTVQCKICNGQKVLQKEESFSVSNMYQIVGNHTKYLKDYGHQSKHYRSRVGTMILNIVFINDEKFNIYNDGTLEVKKLNIHYEDAISGNTIEYKHLDGKTYKLKLPEKTQDGHSIRMNGLGLLKDVSTRADLILNVNIIVDYERLKI